jgi:hypothetical protein
VAQHADVQLLTIAIGVACPGALAIIAFAAPGINGPQIGQFKRDAVAAYCPGETS